MRAVRKKKWERSQRPRCWRRHGQGSREAYKRLRDRACATGDRNDFLRAPFVIVSPKEYERAQKSPGRRK